MALTRRWIKLGRLFLVAFLAFYSLPIWVIVTTPFAAEDKLIGLTLLIASGAVWAWFWTRILDGPDSRFRVVAIALATVLIGLFSLMTPPQYGSFFVIVVLMIGAAFSWRVAVPLVALAALVGGALDLARGTSAFEATGEVLNDAIVGLVAVAGRLVLEANQQLSLAREQIARLAVGEERLRFARDLHDLLGHSLSVIALKSELAGRLIKRSPGLAEHEVEDIEKVARDALREVREAVAGYRQPTLKAELAGAREAMLAAGIECRVEEEVAAVPPAIEAVLAWTVREGATNVIRHSSAHRCTIRASQKDGVASVEVIDDGRGGTPQPGSGLRGLEERVRERGGTLSAGALPHEGFRLRVWLPLAASSTPTAPTSGGRRAASQ
jgi:two-component system sensor histidine kinase DesK